MITLRTQSWFPVGPDIIHGMRKCCASQLAVCHAGRYGLTSMGMECQLCLRRFARGLGHMYTDISEGVSMHCVHVLMCISCTPEGGARTGLPLHWSFREYLSLGYVCKAGYVLRTIHVQSTIVLKSLEYAVA